MSNDKVLSDFQETPINAPVAPPAAFSRGGRPRKLSKEDFLALWVKCGGNLAAMESQLTDVDYRTLQRYKDKYSEDLAKLEAETAVMREELKPIDVFAEIPEIIGWKTWMRENELADASIETNMSQVRSTWAFLGKKRPVATTSEDIIRFRTSRKGTYADGQGFNVTVAWRNFYTYLIKKGESAQIRESARNEPLLEKGATKKQKSKHRHVTEKDYFRREEYAAFHELLQYEDLAFHAACDLGKETGTRIGGIIELRACDINFDSKEIVTHEKGGHIWHKHPTPHTFDLLKRLIDSRGLTTASEENLFPNALYDYNPRVKALVVKAGIKKPLRFHSFRHTFATWNLNRRVKVVVRDTRTGELIDKEISAPVPSKTVAQEGGWEHEGTMLEFYASPDPDALSAILEVVSL